LSQNLKKAYTSALELFYSWRVMTSLLASLEIMALQDGFCV